MKLLLILAVVTSFGLGLQVNNAVTEQTTNDARAERSGTTTPHINEEGMKLGAFSISLSVKDIAASKKFYEDLGFEVLGGDLAKNYLIMKNGNALVGLFQGMFEGNILTFNPGWDESGHNIEKFDDIREIQRQLKGKGHKIVNEADEKTSGPASFMITDPDGNVILLDQHR